MAVKSLRARQMEATRQLLVATARDLFTDRGYTRTSIEDIIQRAGVARGALYHHFPGKDALFRAVYEEVESETVSSVLQAAMAAGEPWAAARAGLSAFLDACLQPAFRRIVILDSVAVVQEDVRKGEIAHRELPMLRTVLAPLVDTGLLPGLTVEPLVHIALGGLYGAALFIATSPDPLAARAEADSVVELLLRGLQTAATDG